MIDFHIRGIKFTLVEKNKTNKNKKQVQTINGTVGITRTNTQTQPLRDNVETPRKNRL